MSATWGCWDGFSLSALVLRGLLRDLLALRHQLRLAGGDVGVALSQCGTAYSFRSMGLWLVASKETDTATNKRSLRHHLDTVGRHELACGIHLGQPLNQQRFR